MKGVEHYSFPLRSIHLKSNLLNMMKCGIHSCICLYVQTIVELSRKVITIPQKTMTVSSSLEHKVL